MRYQERVRCAAIAIGAVLLTYVTEMMADSTIAATPIRLTDVILIGGMIAQSGMVFYFAGGMASRVRALESWKKDHEDGNRTDFDRIPSRDLIRSIENTLKELKDEVREMRKRH